MRRRTRFTFGAETFDTSLSVMPWTPANETIGSWRDSAAGVPASYIVRTDFLVDLTLRVLETEFVAFENFVAYGQTSEQVTWMPDIDEPGTTFEVYLVSPKPGERWSPTRNSDYQRLFEVSITLRGVGTVAPRPDYFTDD